MESSQNVQNDLSGSGESNWVNVIYYISFCWTEDFSTLQ